MRNRIRFLSAPYKTLFVLLSGFWAWAPQGWARNQAEVTIDPKTVLNRNLEGFGHVIGGLDGMATVPVNDAEAKRYFQAFEDYGPGSFWRVMTAMMYWEPFNDNEDSWLANLKDGFIFSPDFEKRAEIDEMKKRTIWDTTDWNWIQDTWSGLIRVLDYCESRGITVNFNNAFHGTVYGNPNHPALSKYHRHWDRYCWVGETEFGERQGTRPNYSDDWGWGFFLRTSCNDCPYDMEEYGEAMATMIYYLKVVKNYKCVKYFIPYAEPHHIMTSPGVSAPGFELEMHAAVDRHLRKYTFSLTGNKKDAQTMDLRDQVKIMPNFYPYYYHGYTYKDDNGKPHALFNDSISSAKELLPWILSNKNKIGEQHTGDYYLDVINDKGWDTLRFDFDPEAKYVERLGGVNSIDYHCRILIPEYLEIIKKHCSQPKEMVFIEGGAFVEEKDKWKPFEFIQVESAIRMMATGAIKGHHRWRADGDFISKPDKKFVPWRYSPYALLTHFVKKGSDVIRTEIAGQIEDDSKVWPAAGTPTKKVQRIWPVTFRSPDGKLSIVVVNDSANEADLKLQIPSDKELKLGFYYVYDSAPEDEKITTGLDRVNKGNKVSEVKKSGDFGAVYANARTTVTSRIHGCSIVVFSEIK